MLGGKMGGACLMPTLLVPRPRPPPLSAVPLPPPPRLLTSLSSMNCLASVLNAWMVGCNLREGSFHTRLRSCPTRLHR